LCEVKYQDAKLCRSAIYDKSCCYFATSYNQAKRRLYTVSYENTITIHIINNSSELDKKKSSASSELESELTLIVQFWFRKILLLPVLNEEDYQIDCRLGRNQNHSTLRSSSLIFSAENKKKTWPQKLAINHQNNKQAWPQLMFASTNTTLSVVQKMETVNNTRIYYYYEEFYFIKMLILIYFLNLGKEQWHMSWV